MKRIIYILFLLVTSLPFMNAQFIINTYAGNGATGFGGDGGPATSANLNFPYGVAVDAVGNIYIAEKNNHRVRKVNTSGVISTFAGNGTNSFSGDGGLATSASLSFPWGVAVDAAGNVYIADYGNQRIRKVNTSGIISTIAGTGAAGFSGDGGAGTLAMINSPFSIASDAAGNVYIGDCSNYRVRKISTSGIISTVAGNGISGFSGDGGPATSAMMKVALGVHIDALGNLYISDAYNSRVRKVNTSGIITTIAGTGTAGFSGDGGLATSAMVDSPGGMNLDPSGNLYFSDNTTLRIRVISASGIINTIAGNGTLGSAGDGGIATAAQLWSPQGLARNSTGDIYIADTGNQRIRKLTATVGIDENNNTIYFSIFPNPSNGTFKLLIENPIEEAEIVLINSLGQTVHEQKITEGTNDIITKDLSSGFYNYILFQNKKKIKNGKLAIE